MINLKQFLLFMKMLFILTTLYPWIHSYLSERVFRQFWIPTPGLDECLNFHAIRNFICIIYITLTKISVYPLFCVKLVYFYIIFQYHMFMVVFDANSTTLVLSNSYFCQSLCTLVLPFVHCYCILFNNKRISFRYRETILLLLFRFDELYADSS